MPKEILELKAPKLQIIAKEHFHVEGIKKGPMDLSILLPIYFYVDENWSKLPKNEELEVTIGRSTIVYSIDFNNIISLITGWPGNRKKKKSLAA